MKESSLLTLLLLIPSISSQNGNSKLETKAVPGLYKSEIPSPSTFYQSVVPLLYEFKIPKWINSDLTLPLGPNCSSPESTKSASCPVRFYLPEVLSRFSEYLFDSQPLVNTLQFMNASPQMSDIQFECDILAKHFRDVYIDSEVFERYLSKLKRCSPLGDMEFYRKVSNYKYNISEVFLKMQNGFNSQDLMNVDRIDSDLRTNPLNTLQSLAIMNYYVEANRWKFALGDCQSGRTPTSILAPALFADSLQDLFTNLDESRSGLVPVISPADVGNYYQAEIADCTYTNETFIVRILVPVIPSHQSYSLMELESAKFFDKKNGRVCQVQLPVSPYVLFDNMEKVAYETDCKPNELCHVPSVKSKGKINPCASAYLNGHFFNVLKYCELTCEEISPYHLGGGGRLYSPMVQQVESDKFILTWSLESMYNSSSVTLRCPGRPDQSVASVPSGALELTLPCLCTLYTDARISYKSSTSCSGSESVNATAKLLNIAPLHWMNALKLRAIRSSQVKRDEIPFRFDEADLQYQSTSDAIAMLGKETQNNSTSHAESITKIVFVLYFLLIAGLGLMIMFLTYRLKTMGVSVNPLKGIQRSHSISYANIGRRNENGLMSNEESPYNPCQSVIM